MGMHKGIEYDFVDTTGTVYMYGQLYPIPKYAGLTRDECARRAIEALLSDHTNSIRPKGPGSIHTEVADVIMNNLRNRKGVLEGIEADILDEIHEEIRSELATRYGRKL